MYITGLNNIYANQMNEKIFGANALKKKEKEEDLSVTEKSTKDSQGQTEDSLEISLEGRLAAEQFKITQEETDSDTKEAEETAEGSSEETSGKVAVNEGKRARQIAAARTRGQVQQVLALLQKDLADCKAGLEKGWCDESEIAKVEALINSAKSRLSQVPQESEQDSQGGLDEFAMASLM